MIPTYTNSSSFPFELNNDHHNNNIHHFSPYNNYQFASSSTNSTCQTFFNISTTNVQDQSGFDYHSQFHQPQHQHEVHICKEVIGFFMDRDFSDLSGTT